MATKLWPSKEGLDRHTSFEPCGAEGMATKLSRPSKGGLDRRISFEPGMAEGMATELLRPSKEGLDRRDDANT
eukprot:2723288-Karenia_brevis.AAC.1